MRGRALVALLFLLAPAPALAARPIVAEVTLDGAAVAQPVLVPFDFGPHEVGDIATVVSTICFKQPTSPQGSCDASGALALTENLAPPFYLAGQFRENIGTGVKTAVNFPLTLPAGQRLNLFIQYVADDVGSDADDLVLRGTPTGGADDELRFALSGTGVPPGPCVPTGQALCLNNDRFKVQSHFLTGAAANGQAGAVELTADTGYFFFFSASNVEAVVKVLNACSFNNRYWVFAGGLTDVRTVITVTDTQADRSRSYVNPLGKTYQPIQDTSAFATCP